MISSGIRAVVFDAVGTLIEPQLAAADGYASVGRRFGRRLPLEEVGQRFRVAFGQEESQDRLLGWKTTPIREVERWQTIVGRVLDDVSDAMGCFRALFDHFGRPEAWKLKPGAAGVLAR